MAIPSGEIYLLKNIPLNPSYEHTIDFKDKNEQFNYFMGHLVHRLENYSFIRKEREFLRVELPFSELDGVNYLLFKSEEGARLYYAFIVNRVYVDDTTTEIHFLIDVMQTFQFDYEWRASYIKQAHVDRWTAEHKPIYSKTDEGLDYGTEYSIESAYSIQQSKYVRWLLVTMTEHSEIISEGAVVENSNLEPVSSPYSCFFIPVPISTNKEGGRMTISINNISDNGLGDDIGVIGDYSDFCKLMLKSAIGNYVKSISLLTYNPYVEKEGVETLNNGDTPAIKIDITLLNGVFSTTTFTGSNAKFLVLRSTVNHELPLNNTLARADWNIGLDASLPTDAQWAEIKSKPYTTARDKRFESKLLCAPYRYNLLTDWRNNPVIFKNEYMTPDKIEIKYSFALSTNAPFRYWIKDYKRDIQGRYTCLSQPIALEMPIISDAYYTYMLENKNTIQANLTNSIVNATAGTISGAISGGGMGGIFGAIFGGVSGGVSGALNVQATVRGENAKQADLLTKPDSIINSTDSAFNIMDGNDSITFYRMRVCCENEEILAEIFNMSGYKVNRLEIPNTRSRTRFNYIQTLGANIVGNINQADLMQIKEVFDRGITIWHYHDTHFNMLDYSFENIEVNLL